MSFKINSPALETVLRARNIRDTSKRLSYEHAAVIYAKAGPFSSKRECEEQVIEGTTRQHRKGSE